MSIEKEAKNNYTPEQQASLEKQRTISDAELLKRGAEYELDENGGKKFLIKERQAQELREEKEGMADTLGTYIRMHKSIVIPNGGDDLTPADQMVGRSNEPLSKIFQERKGSVWPTGPYSLEYYFIDKDGDLATFALDPAKVKSLEAVSTSDVQERDSAIKAELFGLGFTLIDTHNYEDNLTFDIIDLMRKRRDAAKKKENEEKGKGFSF
jgi:hypothetical protein